MKTLAIFAATFLTGLSLTVAAEEPKEPAKPDGPTLQLRAQQSPDGSQVVVDAVDRTKVNEKQFVDMIGLRLWVDNADSLQRLRAFVSTPGAALAVKEKLGASIMETGVEPDMIPVHGEEGKKLKTDGMVLLEKGEFTRSGEYWDSSGGGLGENDKPFRGDKYQVRVAAFYIDKYKVTNEEYCRFLNDGNVGYWTPWNQQIGKAVEGENAGKFIPADHSLAKRPVVLVNWYQAKGYAKWAGKQLPTEAQWEYAAGGKEGRRYPWGNEPPDDKRLDFPIQYKHTVPVDWFPAGATPEGVFQMAGNSGEWCADYFDNASYQKAPADGVAVNPKGAQ
ncbi:MAG: SUMF1/EgtB/PvdO family nonheme iron enzyme [Planctomycetaceae bacterium]|nr:SUMF1/EgtB/PvdO family nonheme iron enzyme [Planctomycetaceae bacterium]